MKLHRYKCTAIISNVLGPHFTSHLIESIGDSYYSILINESTDISITKYLGITIMYFDKNLN